MSYFRLLKSILNIFSISLLTVILFLPFVILALIDIKKVYFIQKIWARYILFVCGVKLKIHYEVPLTSKGSILLFNHKSFLDIPILVLVSQRFMFYVAKKELGRIPVLGLCLKIAKTLMMPRNDLKASVALYEEAKIRLKNGDQFVIAPEGQRHRGSEGLGEFKSGPFIFAMSCQSLLIPVVISGVDALWPAQDLIPNLRKTKANVFVYVGAPISTQDWTESSRKVKMLEIKNYFLDKLKDLKEIS